MLMEISTIRRRINSDYMGISIRAGLDNLGAPPLMAGTRIGRHPVIAYDRVYKHIIIIM